MSYIDETLGSSETLIYRGRYHWLHKLGAWIVLIAFVAAAVVAFVTVAGWLAILLVALGLVFFTGLMLPMWTTEIGVTTQRFIFKRGWLWRKTDELQLRAIEEVNLEQGIAGRLFGFGRLIVHGTGVNDIRLPVLADPVALRKALQEGMAVAAPVAAAPITSAPPNHGVPAGPGIASSTNV
jgi:uncharacterized membrane protein YdbT with pleckstrin-like domain